MSAVDVAPTLPVAFRPVKPYRRISGPCPPGMIDPQHLLDASKKLPDHPVVAKRGRDVDYGLTDRFLDQLTTASKSALSWAEPGLLLPGLLRRVEDVFNTGRLRDEDSDASVERLGFSIADSQGRLPLGQRLAACGVRQTPVEFEADLVAAMVWDPSRRGGRPAYHIAWSSLQAVVSRLHGFKAEGPRLEPPGPRRKGGDDRAPLAHSVPTIPVPAGVRGCRPRYFAYRRASSRICGFRCDFARDSRSSSRFFRSSPFI